MTETIIRQTDSTFYKDKPIALPLVVSEKLVGELYAKPEVVVASSSFDDSIFDDLFLSFKKSLLSQLKNTTHDSTEGDNNVSTHPTSHLQQQPPPPSPVGAAALRNELKLKECVMKLISENNALNGQLKSQQALTLDLQRELVREKITRSELMKSHVALRPIVSSATATVPFRRNSSAALTTVLTPCTSTTTTSSSSSGNTSTSHPHNASMSNGGGGGVWHPNNATHFGFYLTTPDTATSTSSDELSNTVSSTHSTPPVVPRDSHSLPPLTSHAMAPSPSKGNGNGNADDGSGVIHSTRMTRKNSLEGATTAFESSSDSPLLASCFRNSFMDQLLPSALLDSPGKNLRHPDQVVNRATTTTLSSTVIPEDHSASTTVAAAGSTSTSTASSAKQCQNCLKVARTRQRNLLLLSNEIPPTSTACLVASLGVSPTSSVESLTSMNSGIDTAISSTAYTSSSSVSVDDDSEVGSCRTSTLATPFELSEVPPTTVSLADVTCVPCGHVLCKPCVDEALHVESHRASHAHAELHHHPLSRIQQQQGQCQDATSWSFPQLMTCPVCDACLTDVTLLADDVSLISTSLLSSLSSSSSSRAATSSLGLMTSAASTPMAYGSGPHSPFGSAATTHLSDIETVLDRFDGDIQKSIDYLLAEYAHATAVAEDGMMRGGGGGSYHPHPSCHGPNASLSLRSNSTCGPTGGPSLSNWKTEVCIYFLQGKCNKTIKTCSFAHGDDDLVKPLQGNVSGVTASLVISSNGTVSNTPANNNHGMMGVMGGTHTHSSLPSGTLVNGLNGSMMSPSASAAVLQHISAGQKMKREIANEYTRNNNQLNGSHLSSTSNNALLHSLMMTNASAGHNNLQSFGGPPIMMSMNNPNNNGPGPRSQNYKTELCYYFLKGCCNYTSEECRFAHGPVDLRKPVELTSLSTQHNNPSLGQLPMPLSSHSSSPPHASHAQPPLHQVLQQQPPLVLSPPSSHPPNHNTHPLVMFHPSSSLDGLSGGLTGPSSSSGHTSSGSGASSGTNHYEHPHALPASQHNTGSTSTNSSHSGVTEPSAYLRPRHLTTPSLSSQQQQQILREEMMLYQPTLHHTSIVSQSNHPMSHGQGAGYYPPTSSAVSNYPSHPTNLSPRVMGNQPSSSYEDLPMHHPLPPHHHHSGHSGDNNNDYQGRGSPPLSMHLNSTAASQLEWPSIGS